MSNFLLLSLIWYKFKLPESVPVYEEYLIYDAIGMIGAVGGSLGMFLGCQAPFCHEGSAKV